MAVFNSYASLPNGKLSSSVGGSLLYQRVSLEWWRAHGQFRMESQQPCLMSFPLEKHVTSALAPRLKLRVPTLDNLPGTFYKHLKLIQNVCIYIYIYTYTKIWRFPETGVLPNHSCMDGISLNKPSIWGTPILGNLHTVDACETTGLSLPTITKHSPPPPLIRNTWGRF